MQGYAVSTTELRFDLISATTECTITTKLPMSVSITTTGNDKKQIYSHVKLIDIYLEAVPVDNDEYLLQQLKQIHLVYPEN